MKKVDRKFLEEQVKKALNEKEKEEQNWFMKALAASGEAHSVSVKAQAEAAYKMGPMIWEILKSLPFGSPQSYVDLIKWAQDTGTYGIGSQKYYKKIIDLLGPLQDPDARAPWGQQMIRFVNTAPITKENASQINVVFKEDLQNDFIKLRNDTAKAIYLAIQGGKDVEKGIYEILRAKTYGYDPNISAEDDFFSSWSQIRDAYVGPEDGTLADIADDYNFTKTWTDGLWGAPLKFGFINLFKDPRRFMQNGMYKEYSEEFAKLRNMSQIQEAVEKFIMMHFNGLEGANFPQAYQRLIDKAELPRIAKAKAAFETYNESGLAALIGVADILVSVPTTVVFVVSMLGGVTIPVGLAAATGKRAAFSAVRKSVLKNTTKLKNTAQNVLKAEKWGMTIKSMASLKAQSGPLIMLFGQMGWDAIKSYINDIDDEFKKFVDLCEDQSVTAEQKAEFYDNNVKPAYEYIAQQHARLFTAAQFDKEIIVSKVAKPSYIRNLYINCKLYEIQKINENITKVNAEMMQLSAAIQKMSKGLEDFDANNAKVEQAINRADAILNSDTSMKIPDLIKTPVAVPNIDKPTASDKPKKTNNFGGDEKTSDQILKNMQTSFGSNEKTSNQILSDIENALGGAIKEQEETQVISVNLGYKDALEYAKGTEGFSPETTKANIDKIKKLVQSKGKQVKFTPVAALTDVPEGVDSNKFKEFAKEINSHMQTKKVSSITKTAPAAGDKPTTDKVDATQLTKDDIIIVGDSNAAALAYWGKHKGRSKWPEDYVKHPKYATGGTRIYVDSKTKEPLEPAIGAAKTGYILQRLKMWYKDKGENYRPRMAIVHMGYNDREQAPTEGFANIQKTVNFLSSKGASDIRVVLPKGDPSHKKNADVAEWMSTLSDRLENELTGAKLIPNNGRFGKKSDGYHFVNNLKIYNDAISGVTVAGSAKSKPATKAAVTNLSSGAKKYYPLIKREAEKLGYPVSVAMGVAYAESNFRPNLVSSAGAVGLMQLMKVTAKDVGVPVEDRADPETNIRGALTYISKNVPRYFQGDMKQYKTKIQWSDLNEEQKIKFGLYGFQQGVRGVITGISYRKQRMHKGLVAFDDPEEFLSYMKNWYIKRYKYDYVTKILDYANRNGGSFQVSGNSVRPAKQGRANTTASKTKSASIESQIQQMSQANNLGSFAAAYAELLDMSFGSSRRNLSKIISAERQLNSSDISKFVKDRTEYLKTIHRKKFSAWKQEYENDIKNPKNKDEADKKIAFYHRPVFYVTAFTRSTKKFFSNTPQISFAFEPTVNRIAVSYAAREVFYRQDIMGNQVFDRFLKELGLFKRAISATVAKIDPIIEANPNRQDILNDVKSYITKLDNIVSTVSSGLQDTSTSASRKAYLVSILNLAMLTT